jgi:hypothetical protein
MSDFVVDKVEKETTFLGAVSKSYSSCRHANVPQRFCCLQNKSISIQNVWGQAGPRSPGISTHLISPLYLQAHRNTIITPFLALFL